jgi:hypothetical protein
MEETRNEVSVIRRGQPTLELLPSTMINTERPYGGPAANRFWGDLHEMLRLRQRYAPYTG